MSSSFARSRRLVAAVVVMGALGGCSKEEKYQSPMALPTVQMKVGSKTYTLEVAKDEPSRERGLMERESIPRDWGMIFVFPDEDYRGFWMKNTLVPLDILYVDGSGKVVSIHRMEPKDTRTTESKGKAKYAIELNAGEAAASGVKEGDVLSIPALALTTTR